MSKTLQPTNDRILIKPIDEGEQTYGSIVIPDLGKEKLEEYKSTVKKRDLWYMKKLGTTIEEDKNNFLLNSLKRIP